MSWALRDLRMAVKNKLPQLANVGDLISIIWFSGRKQAGILQEAVEIRSVVDFSGINQAIDRYLQPVGMTGFVEPFDLAGALIGRVKATHPDVTTVLFFHTDGMDNQWPEKEIINAVQKLAPVVDKAAVVEYGWYCNRPMLTRIAEELGAATIFAEDFPSFEETFLSYVQRTGLGGGKRVVVPTPGASKPFAFGIAGGDVVTYRIEGDHANVPEGIGKLAYFNGDGATATDESTLYAGLYVLAQRMDTDGVIGILRQLGDVALIQQFASCFSKQDYSNFQTAALEAVTDPAKRYMDGKDVNAVPADDAYTVIDLLEWLASDPAFLFHPYHPSFQYERISAKRADAAESLGDDEKQALIDQIAAAVTPSDLEGAKAMLEALGKRKALKFTPTAADPGCPILALTYNEERPNISIQIKIDGTVELPENNYGIPTTFRTFIYRNYAMVADGIRHPALACLPFELPPRIEDELVAKGVMIGYTPEGYVEIQANLPVINRKMVSTVFAADFFRDAVLLLQAKAAQKVYNTFYKEKFEKRSVAWDVHYTTEGANWLKELGLTEWGGFSPASRKTEPTDMYVAKEFLVKIAGCSSIPAVNEKLLAKVRAGGSLTKSESLLAPAIKEADGFIATALHGAPDPDALLKVWLEGKMKVAKNTVRHLIKEMAKVKFSIMVGHTWFAEFASLDENAMSVTVDGVAYDCSAELRDVEIKI